MSKMKKLLAMVLALAMVLGMSISTMAAANVTGDSDDTGTITVSGIDNDEDGITVTAYQIVRAKYENGGSFSGFEVVYPDVTPAINLTPDSTGKIAITLENLNAIIDATKVEGTDYEMTPAANGDWTAEVPVGSYLVLISDAEAKVYSPIVVSVNYTNSNGNNVITPGNVNVENFKIVNGTAWVKESTVPTFTKIEADAVADTNNDFAFGNSVDVGNDVNYTLTIGSIPYYGGKYPVFNVVDTLDTGLTFKQDTLVVKVDGTPLTKGTDYTVKVDGQKVTIDFVVGGNYKLNNHQGKAVVITYKATLNTNTKYNTNANVNTATLTFTYDSKVNNVNVQDKITEETYTYTFNLTDSIIKTAEGEHKAKLPGAKFVLYTDAACTIPYTNGFTTNGEYVTNSNGNMEIKGLEAGTYYLKEKEAPNGYSVNTHVFKIEIVANYQTTATADGKDVGELTSWEIKVDDQTTATLTIPNTKLASLPSTGGIGTTIFTVAGCGIMIAAAYLFFNSRKREEA